MKKKFSIMGTVFAAVLYAAVILILYWLESLQRKIAISSYTFHYDGVIAVAAVLPLTLFVLAGLRVSLACRDRFGCLLGTGITSMIGLQAFINMGVVTGILPTTGLPLPFFSAGGTSVSMIMAAVGILLSISRENGVRVIETDDRRSGGRT